MLSLKALAIPIFFDMLLRYLSLMINTYMVSQYSSYLVGSMGAGNQILDLFITVFAFISVGCSVVISQSIGAKNSTLASKALHQSLLVNTIIGLVCGGLILLCGDFFLTLLNVPNGQFYQASVYLKMLGICLVFDSISIILSSIVRVYNMAYFVTLTSFFMNIIAIIFNYYTLNYTNWELWGVGLSTIISRISSIAMLLFCMVFLLKIRFQWSYLFSIHKDVLKKICSIGMFSAGENLLWIIQYTIALSFVYSLGEENASVQTVYFQISMVIMLSGQAISIANEIIIGKLVGARFKHIAYKHSWMVLRISLLITLFVVLVNFYFRDDIMDVLNINNIFRDIMLPLFSISIILELGRTFNIVMVNSLRASGDAKFPFIVGIIFMFGFSLPIGYVLCFNFNLGIIGIWIGFCVDEWLRGISNAYRWKSRRWQYKMVV